VEVWVTGRTEARIEAVAEEIGGHALGGDVSHEDDVARWFDHAGPVVLLVNNAGVQGTLVPFDREEPASWWQVFSLR
jgi:NADP-dependent 3-hydroxy acid dehydrogenase YdfG